MLPDALVVLLAYLTLFGNRSNHPALPSDNGAQMSQSTSDQWDRGFNIWDPFMELFHNKTQDRYRKYAQPLILMIGAANQRDECVDRLTCQLSNYVPDFQLRPVALVLLEQLLSPNNKWLRGPKAKLVLDDDCARFLCYSEAL